MSHPATLPGRIRYLPSFALQPGFQYIPPSFFKQRAIDIVLLACIFFPSYRRHSMRKRPIYKFLDVKTGNVIYYDNLNDYKEAIYTRIPEKLPGTQPGFFTRYEFDFRDRAYSSYLAYEPFWLRTRNWLTFNNWRSNKQHFEHRLKDNKWSLNTVKRPKRQWSKPKQRHRLNLLYGLGTRQPHSDRIRYGSGAEYGGQHPAKFYREQAPSTYIDSENMVDRSFHHARRLFHPFNLHGMRMFGDVGLEYNTEGPRMRRSFHGVEAWKDHGLDQHRKLTKSDELFDRELHEVR